jgi:NhaP-type Na+/H+ or K+/H+ antiporter
MTEMVLGFNQKLEHIAECAMVLLLGVILSGSGFSFEGAAVAVLLFLLVRPVAVFAALVGMAPRSPLQNSLLAWFGIRGIGTLYYLVFSLQFPWLPDLTHRFISLVGTVVAISIVLHGISSTPLMGLYYQRKRERRLG